MAHIILTPIAKLIIDTLGSAAVEEIKSVYGASGELSKLESTLSAIRSVLVDAEKRQIREEQVRDWLEKLEDVFFDADDLVDGVNADGLRRKLMPTRNKLVKKVRTFFSSDNQLVFRHKLASRIKDIRERLDAISADKERFHFVKLPEEILPARRVRADSYSFVVQENVVGRDKDKRAIVELLLNPENRAHQEKVSIIPIVGMGGLGKTTLAQLVFNDEKVQQHFELKIWVCVSNDFSVEVICKKIIKTITDERVENDEMEQLQIKLRQLMTEKRYLLVLDDVWSEEGRKWKELKDLLTANCSTGSRIIVTTRLHTVANVMSTMQSYDLGILDSEDSWNLFKKMADHEGKELSDQKMEIAKEILAKCAGLPLAISLIGSVLLSSRIPEIEWPSFLKKELSNIPQGEDGILPTLRLSFDVLPSHLKACFAYCSLFPKDHEFDVQTLITLWLAHGFIRSDQSQSLEETGYGYFEDLLWRSFFQEAKKDEVLNMVTTCKMHDLVHDLAIQVAGEKYALLTSCEENLRKSVRHISFDVSSTYSFKEIPRSWLQGQRIRSFRFSSKFYKIRDSKLDEAISNLKFLRTLDLSDGGIETVPDSVGKLKHLRYLDLSDNWIKTLPASITELVHLQTLKLNWCEMLCELPSEIEKLVNLRHLELKDCDSLTHMPRGLSQLTNLQTISLFVLTENVPNGPYSQLNELMGMENLSGQVKINGIISGMVTTASKLRENNRLQSLHLNFGTGEDNASKWKTTPEGLQPRPNLKELSLDQYGGSSLSGFLPMLTNLVKLFLENCSKCQQLPSLDKFHSLKEMSLNTLPSLEYITINEGDNYFSTSSSQSVSVLPSLQTLSLIELPKFRGWWRSGMTENQVEQLILPSFPRLSSLAIRGCEKLTSMPRYPNIEGGLELQNTSWKTFEQTSTTEEASSSSTIPTIVSVSSYALSKLTLLFFIGVEDLQCAPDERMKGLASLKRLGIMDCPALKYLSPWILYLTSLEDLLISDCKEFEGIKWPENPTLTRLRVLALRRLPKLKDVFTPDIQCLTSLEELEIDSCEGLEEIKLTPALPRLRVLELRRLPKLKDVFAPDIQCLTSLEELEIYSCEGLEEIKLTPALPCLRVLKLIQLPKLKDVFAPDIQCLTSLEKLEIDSCEGLEEIKLTPALPHLRVLKLWGMPKLKHLSSPGVQQHLTSLEELVIVDCRELKVSNDDSIELQALTTLHFLCFSTLPQLVSLPGGLQFLTTLKELRISNCPNFTGLPDWICKLSSLETLYIDVCPKFKSVPASISSLTSLQELQINCMDMNPREIHEDLDLCCLASATEDLDTSRASGSRSWKILKKFRRLQLCNK